MKQIHGGLTIDKVDATMDELREQHALGEEIASAITNAPLGEPVDETELEEELEGLEQEAMDERMLKSGTVPVGGEVARLPSVANGPSKFFQLATILHMLTRIKVRGKAQEEDDEEEELLKLQAEMAM